MLFSGDPVRLIDHVDSDKIKELHDAVQNRFGDKWVRRSFKLMDESFTLKAITPTQFDILDPKDAEDLKTLLMPWINPYVGEDERVIYLDVSSLPAGAKLKAHLDYAFMHVLCKRIMIPLSTNPKSTFSLVTETGIKTYNLKVGSVYEINNQTVHVAGNLGETERWHVIADILDNDAYKFLEKKGLLTGWAFHPSINYLLSGEIRTKLDQALNIVTEDI